MCNDIHVSGCPACGRTATGLVTCCGKGGSWAGNCGNTGDPKFEHTWSEGVAACRANPTPNPDTPESGKILYKYYLFCDERQTKHAIGCLAVIWVWWCTLTTGFIISLSSIVSSWGWWRFHEDTVNVSESHVRHVPPILTCATQHVLHFYRMS